MGAGSGEPDAPAYGASKAAMHAMAQSLALALGKHGISVSVVAPGYARSHDGKKLWHSVRVLTPAH
jgi:NAD(P)-dependent dehydrogenase (short-subunit alcohol dehydrogenase family)